ncbi:MAG: hypothetical protein BWY77_00304 [bacterium ADurb.Bin431]|nr:MAG: hypothetical protein BWY77_00304 [bacterium ADurb.Bin431]
MANENVDITVFIDVDRVHPLGSLIAGIDRSAAAITGVGVGAVAVVDKKFVGLGRHRPGIAVNILDRPPVGTIEVDVPVIFGIEGNQGAGTIAHLAIGVVGDACREQGGGGGIIFKGAVPPVAVETDAVIGGGIKDIQIAVIVIIGKDHTVGSGQSIAVGHAAGAVLLGVGGAGMADIEGLGNLAVGETDGAGDIEIGQGIARDVGPNAAMAEDADPVDHPAGDLHRRGHIREPDGLRSSEPGQKQQQERDQQSLF